MADDVHFNEDTMQVIREIRKTQAESQNRLVRKIIVLIACSVSICTLFLLYLLDDVFGAVDDIGLFSSLLISFICGAALYWILTAVNYVFLKE